MNALTFAATTCCPLLLYVPNFDISRDIGSDYPALLTSAEQAEVEAALAPTDLGVTCFNCCFSASFQRSGQYWCSVNCWVDVMNGARDYWYEGGGGGEGDNGDAYR